MNKLEAAYAEHLKLRRRAGEIEWYAFDVLNLRLAPKCFYRPDFMVMRHDAEIEMHEVKGHWEDDARVKVKVAADKFPFRFLAVTQRPKKHGGGWLYELISKTDNEMPRRNNHT